VPKTIDGEYLFDRAAVARLPPTRASTMRTPAPTATSRCVLRPSSPDARARPPGVDCLAADGPPRARDYYLLQASCQGGIAPVAERCAQAMERYGCRPVSEQEVPAVPFQWERYDSDRVVLGVYRMAASPAETRTARWTAGGFPGREPGPPAVAPVSPGRTHRCRART